MAIPGSRYALRVVGLALLLGVVGCGTPMMNHAGMREAATVKPAVNENTEDYNRIVENPFLTAKENPLSTFSTSVDTAAYSNVRRFINEGKLPPVDAVRIADMLNYFNYRYPEPTGEHPIAMGMEMAPCPWQPKHHLLKIAVKAMTLSSEAMPPRNLVFLIDTSGSMQGDDRIELVKQSLELLVHQLGERDRVSIVTYAGDASLRLPSTTGSKPKRILTAIRGLTANGSTNGGGGIMMAYDQAEKAFIKGGVNRVILATDGDFNVGVSSQAELVRLIERKRETGVFLTVLGYGRGNLRDSNLEQLAHHGNGHFAYIDSIDEAKKVFVDQGGALAVVAKDVKLQVEFNHRQVNAYRLIGYENRVMRAEEFRDDAKDAGDMGSGHTCTALYEIIPVGVDVPTVSAGELKYQKAVDAPAAGTGEWLTLRLRYKNVDGGDGKELAVALPEGALLKQGSDDFRFASAVAGFGMLLGDSKYKGTAMFDTVRDWAAGAQNGDEARAEFIGLVDKAKRLKR